MKRCNLLLTIRIIALLVIGLVLALLIDFSFRPSWAPDGYSKIEHGMTIQEVETLLGAPPGNYCQHDLEIRWVGSFPNEPAPPNSRQAIWFDDSHRFEIYFNEQDRVVSMNERSQFTRPLPPSRWGRLWAQFMNSLG